MSVRFDIATFACLFALSCFSTAAEIDFESLLAADDLRHEHGSVYREDGYTLYYDSSGSIASYGELNENFADSTAVMGAGGYGSLFRFYQSEGAAFDAISIDIVRTPFHNYGSRTIVFYGRLADGSGNVSQSFTTAYSAATFATFNFSEDFKNLSQLYWYSDSNLAQYDNLVVTEHVPAPILPTASAGEAQTVVAGDIVFLDGSASVDANGNPVVAYHWNFSSLPPDSAAELTGADTATPSFYADVAGVYEIRLEVTDSDGNVSESDTVPVTASPPPPSDICGCVPCAQAGNNSSPNAVSLPIFPLLFIAALVKLLLGRRKQPV